uniref:SCP domain-containing protein n=1 Tax=Haemonchus contortus TaxID=6289 RepID=A0A7I4YW71_HAECO
MRLIFLVLYFFLVNAELGEIEKKVFKKVHRWYNPKIRWSKQLEGKAQEYLNSKDSLEEGIMVIDGENTYQKDNSLTLGAKLLDTFNGPMWNETEKLTDLPEGTRYGCNLIYQEGSMEDVLRYAYLYKKI